MYINILFLDKLKGLDAPPNTPPPHIPEAIKAFPNKDVSADVNTKMIFEVTSCDRSEGSYVENTSRENNLFTDDQSGDIVNDKPPLTIIATKPQKKNKKKHIIGQRNQHALEDHNINKANEKAHRKALKMYQKICKTQSERGNLTVGFKKSKKALNRGIFSALQEKPTERMQIEKIIKKQTKQRQKQLKSQKHLQRQVELTLNPVTSLLPVSNSLENEVNINKRPITVLDKKNVMSDIATANTDPFDERKIPNEPDRNKLNIFKKISKQKSCKPLLPDTSNNGTNFLEVVPSSGSSLINLPFGTTITPAPSLNATNNVNICSHPPAIIKMSPFGETERYFETSDGCAEKPRKRGRKPGCKSQLKHLEFTELTTSSATQVNPPKKSNIPKLPSPSHLSTDSTNNTSSTKHIEPLNLINVDQSNGTKRTCLSYNDNSNEVGKVLAGKTFNETLKLPKIKEKREKKKTKPRNNKPDRNCKDNLQTIDDHLTVSKKLGLMGTCTDMQLTFPIDEDGSSIEKNTQSSMAKCADFNNKGLLSSSAVVVDGFLNGLASETNIHSSNLIYPPNQINKIPMLPLLHFPPRPGLIPTGIFSPTNLTNFSQQVCSTIPNNIIPNPFTTFPTASRSTTRPSLTEKGGKIT